MKTLTLILFSYQLKKARISAEKESNTIVKKAMEHRVKIYESALLFLQSSMSDNRKEIISFINTILQLGAFIGFSYLLLEDSKKAIGLGWMVCLLWWRLENFKNK